MNNDNFQIEVFDSSESASSQIQLPLNFLSFGEIAVDDVKVYIKQSVYKELEKYAASDKSKELGTILLGEYSEDLGKKHVLISDYIEAKYTDASASTLTFTHETWDYIHKEHARKAPQLKIIGWQHTHPNYGIFLSNYDLFIQENFFNSEFQVAYVIDPVQDLRGFFQWKNGKIEKLKGFYIYDEVGKPIKIEQSKPKDANKKSAKINKVTLAIALVLVLLNIISVATLISYSNKNSELAQENEVLTSEIDAQAEEKDQIIQSRDEEIVQLNALLVEAVEPNSTTSSDDLIEIINNSTLSADTKNQLIALLSSFDSGDSSESATFIIYVVEEGDSLYSICEKHNIDFNANINMIMALNGISEDDFIYEGQSLLIPCM
jgi:proteasome lid subunit RPN8/RPN11